MVAKFLKKRSKRVGTKKRTKIEKKVREHNRKLRKQSKLTKKRGKPSKYDKITVPNSCPFKPAILAEAQKRKEEEETRKQTLREELKAKRTSERQSTANKNRNLPTLLADAQERSTAFEEKTTNATQPWKPTPDEGIYRSLDDASRDKSLRTFFTEVKKVLEQSDVIIQVLDARDPLGCRCPQVEKAVLESGKKLVLLLNKVDLIPKHNATAWLTFLRRELPTVPFKASTQQQKERLGFAGADATNTTKCVGAQAVTQLLANYCRNKDIKTSIRVGIVGFPNVGKSSVINSLKRKKACNVGAVPGVTRQAQEVELDKRVRLLDSPGVVMATQGADVAQVALRNAVNLETLSDPITPVEAILRICSKDLLLSQYKLTGFDDVNQFLAQIARRIGKVKKGGVPNRMAAARKILQDWNTGKIRYYTDPPSDETRSEHISAAIVAELGREFDVTGLDSALIEEDGNGDVPMDEVYSEHRAFAIAASTPTEGVLAAPQNVHAMEDVGVASTSVGKKQKVKHLPEKQQKKDATDMQVDLSVDEKIPGNQQGNRKVQARRKKQLKRLKKSDKLANALSDSLSAKMDLSL